MRKIIRFVCACLCICALIGGMVAAFVIDSHEGDAKDEELSMLTLWQIDSFEGGTGSRADYLRAVAEQFSAGRQLYIEVTSLTAVAARQNLENGVVPDIISYGAGFYGIESIVKGSPEVWCMGAYCMISLNNADFGAATAENTVINSGRDNLSGAAALFRGVYGADASAPTSAYVQLINGEYDYLLGTQRDIQRLKTRNVNFYVEPVTQFNDLYQYIAVLSQNAYKASVADEFIVYLLSQWQTLTKLSMLSVGNSLYSDRLHVLEVQYEYGLPAVAGREAIEKIMTAIRAEDINLLKSLLKPL